MKIKRVSGGFRLIHLGLKTDFTIKGNTVEFSSYNWRSNELDYPISRKRLKAIAENLFLLALLNEEARLGA